MFSSAALIHTDPSLGVTEWDKHWTIVSKNPFDFQAWEYLVRLAENASGGITKGSEDQDLFNLRLVYDHLLSRFPLCFGYWKKYADWELSLVDTVKAEEIYERGVASIHNSIELWNHYLSFKIDYFQDISVVRELFERAAKSCGFDFLAHPFWDKYIEFEGNSSLINQQELRGNMDRVLYILERVIHIPLHQYARYFEKYSQVSALRPIQELASPDDIKMIDEQVRKEPMKSTETGGQVAKTESDFQADIRAHIQDLKSKIYLRTQESVIKRPYFHFKPLDEKQLDIWRKYLDYEEECGTPHSIYTLYERALVVCASYEEFWSRYAKYLIQRKDYDNAKNAFLRASLIHIPETRPYITIQMALFEEERNKIDDARQIFEELLVKGQDIYPLLIIEPNQLEVLKKYLYFEIRHKKEAESFDSIVKRFMEKTTDDKIKGVLFAEKAKHAYQIEKDVIKARKLFKEAIAIYPSVKLVNFGYILFELSQLDSKKIREAWDSIKENIHLDPLSKQTIGKRYLEYLDETNTSVSEYNAAEWYVSVKRIPKDSSKKRAREDQPN